MKVTLRNFSIIGAIFAGLFMASCQKDPLDQEEQIATVPFKTITITCAGENATGEVIQDRKVKFTFNEAEDFTDATIAVEMNSGWTMTFPTELEHVNLSDTPVFNFKDNKNKVVKYYITFSSNAFPITDESKIQISDLEPGTGFILDNSKKTITIKYNQDKLVYEAITINFLEGALQEGVELPANLTYDFSNGIEQELVLKLGGDRVYKVILDVSDYQKKQLSDFAFTDETVKYNLPADSPVKVWATNTIAGVPLNVLQSTKYDEAWNGNNYAYYLSGYANPRDWGVAPHGDDQNIGKIIEKKGYPDWTFDDIFLFPGDWTNDRTNMNAFGKLAIVLIDREKVNVGMLGNAEGVALGEASHSLVAATGLNHTSNQFKRYLLNVGGQMIQNDTEKPIPYRIGLSTKDGKLNIGVIGNNGNNLYKIPYNTDLAVDRQAVASGMSEKLEADNAAYATSWGIHNGKLMGINEMVANDCCHFLSDDGYLGNGWNTNYYFNHILLGLTYDNKIALMISIPGDSQWEGAPQVNHGHIFPDGFYYHGYSLKQMLWLAGQLGWREAVDISHTEDGSDFVPAITVNGVGVISSGDCAKPRAVYDNNGAGIKASYILTVDAK